MPRFRKRPIETDAVQFTGDNFEEIQKFTGYENDGHADGWDILIIETLEGDMTVSPGDWVIRGVAGEVYPCKSGFFEQTYELVADNFPAPGEPRLDLLETDVTG